MTDSAEHRSEELRKEVEQTRTQIGETLQAIQKKLSLGRLLDETVDRVGGRATAVAAGYFDAALPQNPLPVVLIGVGMGWLVLSHLSTDSSAGSPKPRRLPDSTAWTTEQQQSLWLAGIGIVTGAALGTLLPPTERENEWLGQYRDHWIGQVQGQGEKYRAKAQSVVVAAQRAAEAEVRQLTEGNTRASLYDTARQVVDIPKAALEAAVEEAQQQGLIAQQNSAKKPFVS